MYSQYLNNNFIAGVLILAMIYLAPVPAYAGGRVNPIALVVVAVVAFTVAPYLVGAFQGAATGVSAGAAAVGAGTSVSTAVSVGGIIGSAAAQGVVASWTVQSSLIYLASSIITDQVQCQITGNAYVFSSCGGQNSNPAGGGTPGGGVGGGDALKASNLKGGKIGSCPAGNKLCGTSGCIPSDATCCANIGVTNQYCSAGYYCIDSGSGGASCKKDGSGTAQCSSLQGTKCVSPANSCGQTNTSTYVCDGSCTVYTPPDSGCTTPDITLTVPSFTAYGKECVITSKVKNAQSCSINGVNVKVPEGTFTSAPLTATTDFTLVCKNGSVVTAQKTATCRLTPTFQEI